MPRRAIPKDTYTTLAGEVIEYRRPRAEIRTFLGALHDALNTPTVSEAEFTRLLYGNDNPILDQSVFPGRGAVTKAVFANPLYHVMLDLLDHKRIQCGTLNLKKRHAEYTMTVPEAAEKLGITESSVRFAIKSGRLDAIKPAGSYLLNPKSVQGYKVSGRGT